MSRTALPTLSSSRRAASGPATASSWRSPATVAVRAKVAFAARTPLAVAHGGVVPAGGRKLVGDTVDLHGPRREGEFTPEGETRLVELVVNGRRSRHEDVPADDHVHDLEFTVPIERSSWVALRHFPQLHTNPVDVLVGGRPIRASRRSAMWCSGAAEQLWSARGRSIGPPSATKPARRSTAPSSDIAGSRPRLRMTARESRGSSLATRMTTA